VGDTALVDHIDRGCRESRVAQGPPGLPSVFMEVRPAIPAATVVVCRDGDHGLDVVMLRRNGAISFGGMWVFPGGRVDGADHGPDHGADELVAARRAAVREAREEAALDLDPDALVPFAHWEPPPDTPKRFSTWFFLTPVQEQHALTIDGTEIHEACWIGVHEALHKAARREIAVVAPTWVTLRTLVHFATVGEAVTALGSVSPPSYSTRIAHMDGCRVALWDGDVAYQSGEVHTAGPRRRLEMRDDGWVFHGSLHPGVVGPHHPPD
jgi:8-oxo-dGTP pyrophosphatase MutT (NUDIX family)